MGKDSFGDREVERGSLVAEYYSGNDVVSLSVTENIRVYMHICYYPSYLCIPWTTSLPSLTESIPKDSIDGTLIATKNPDAYF